MRTKVAQKKIVSMFNYRAKTGDLPATQRMLHLVRTELKSELRAGFKSVEARFTQSDLKFAKIDGRLDQMELRFKEMDAKVESKLEKLSADVSRIGILMEEQNSRNATVMEGLTGLWQRQSRLEKRSDHVEDLVREIAKGRY